jgi:hypothetical protein
LAISCRESLQKVGQGSKSGRKQLPVIAYFQNRGAVDAFIPALMFPISGLKPYTGHDGASTASKVAKSSQ